MKSREELTKAEKRQILREKAKKAPKGGTLSGQLSKMRTSRNYAGKKK